MNEHLEAGARSRGWRLGLHGPTPELERLRSLAEETGRTDLAHLQPQGGSAQTIAQQEVELFIMVVYGRNFHVEDDEKNPLTS